MSVQSDPTEAPAPARSSASRSHRRGLDPARGRRPPAAPLVVRDLDQPGRAEHGGVHGHVELAPRRPGDPQRRREPGSRRALRERGRASRGREAAALRFPGPLGSCDRRAAPGLVPDRRPRARATGFSAALQGDARADARDARAGPRGRRRSRLDVERRGDARPARDHRGGRRPDRHRQPGRRQDPG